jgi:putative flippase GtrA
VKRNLFKWVLLKLGVTDRDSFYKLLFQVIKFSIIGLTNAVISLAIYQTYITFFPGAYILANVIAWVVSVASAYLLNRRFVFKDNNVSFWNGLIKGYIAYFVSLVISSLLLVLWIEVLHISERIAPVINIVLMTPLNFLMHKFFTFRRIKKKPPDSGEDI